jgi:hypothetical protein
MGMTTRARSAQSARRLATLAGGLVMAFAVQAGAAERVVLGEYFTSIY